MTATASVPSTTDSVSRATVDVGNIMATGGQVMLMLYACLLIILMLLVFIFLKEWLNQRAADKSAAGLKEATTAIAGLHLQVTRLESTNGQLLALLLQERAKP